MTDAELLNVIESIDESSIEESTQHQTNVGIRKGVLENLKPNTTEVKKTYLHQSCEVCKIVVHLPSTSDITQKEGTGLADFFQSFTGEDILGTEVQHENEHTFLTKSIQTSSNSQMVLHDKITQQKRGQV